MSIAATGKHTYVDGKCTICGAVDPDYKPEQPDSQDPADKPTTPEEPDTNKPDAGDGTTGTPQTGDTSGLAIWTVMLLISAAGLTGTVIYMRKRKAE